MGHWDLEEVLDRARQELHPAKPALALACRALKEILLCGIQPLFRLFPEATGPMMYKCTPAGPIPGNIFGGQGEHIPYRSSTRRW